MDKLGLQKLQKLSNILLDDSQQEIFLKKLDPIILKLNELGKLNLSDVYGLGDFSNTLRTIKDTKDFPNKKKIMKNVEHELVNNSIVVKSVI